MLFRASDKKREEMSIKVVEYITFQFPKTVLHIRFNEMWDWEI